MSAAQIRLCTSKKRTERTCACQQRLTYTHADTRAQVIHRLDLEDLAGPACRLVAAAVAASSVTLYSCRASPPNSPRLCALLPPCGPAPHPGSFAAAAASWDFDNSCNFDAGEYSELDGSKEEFVRSRPTVLIAEDVDRADGHRLAVSAGLTHGGLRGCSDFHRSAEEVDKTRIRQGCILVMKKYSVQVHSSVLARVQPRCN